MDLLADLNARDGTTIISVLHDVGLAAHFFPRIVVLEAGRVVADGPPAEALSHERIRDVFGVDPGLVRLPASLRGSAVV
jgi:iron complex transport system ATP-binding protein